MIFVTVGGSPLEFTRLVVAMDDIAKNINEEVIMQIGSTKFIPKNSKYFTHLTRVQYDDLFNQARVIICHGGAGALINALQFLKPVIVVPRKKEYNEIIDDQQLELTTELEKEGKIIAIYDIKDLYSNICNIKNYDFTLIKDSNLVEKLREYLDNLERQ
ncbi:MAG: glycosyltransferase [Methanoregula sp.]